MTTFFNLRPNLAVVLLVILTVVYAGTARSQVNRNDPNKAFTDGVNAALIVAGVAAECESTKSSYYVARLEDERVTVTQPVLNIVCEAYEPVRIDWEDIMIGEEPAVLYRIVYARSGEPPTVILSEVSWATLFLKSLDGYDVYIEGQDGDGNGVFTQDYTILDET
jgi:hypothetical protein